MGTRYRTLARPWNYVQSGVFIAIPLLGLLYLLRVHVYLGLTLFTEQLIGVFMTLFLVGTFMTLPASKRASMDRLPWYDGILSLLALPAGLWLTAYYPDIVFQFGDLPDAAMWAGALAIVLILEAVRRLVGSVLLATCVVFILYGAYSSHLPGMWAGVPISWKRLITYVYLDANSMLQMLSLAATIGAAFVIFGQVLIHFGGGDSLTNIALLLFGRVRGGPAKASVAGSALVGTVTGAPMSNVFLTGTISIPLMIRVGYPRGFAAAVEAVASAGGQIMPPVMGIAAFLIAERLGIPYSQVALAAIVPAILFFLAVFIQVDLEAARRGLRGLRGDELPQPGPTLASAWPMVLVIGVLVYMIFAKGMDPARAAIFSSALALVVQELRRREWQGVFGRIIECFEGSGRLLLEVAGALAAAGIVVGVMSVSGLGFTLGYVMTQAGKGSLFMLLLVGAAGAIVLGMGMPSVAAYALVAVLVGPALTNYGIDPLAAHLFIFYFAIVSNFTPPVAVTAFAAASLARTSAMRTSLVAVRLGVLAYIMPFLFVYSPTLILKGSPLMVGLSVLTAVIGTIAVGGGLGGYLLNPLSWWQRIVLALSGLGLLVPIDGFGPVFLVNVAGLVGVLVIYALNRAARAPGAAQAVGGM